MPSSLTSVSCIASVGKRGAPGTVFIKVSSRGRIRFRHFEFSTALQFADMLRELQHDVRVRERGCITIEGFDGGAALDIELAQVDGIADELTRAASRASGVKA